MNLSEKVLKHIAEKKREVNYDDQITAIDLLLVKGYIGSAKEVVDVKFDHPEHPTKGVFWVEIDDPRHDGFEVDIINKKVDEL